MNLTAITEKEDVYLKHFFDSVVRVFILTLIKLYMFVMWVRVQGWNYPN